MIHAVYALFIKRYTNTSNLSGMVLHVNDSGGGNYPSRNDMGSPCPDFSIDPVMLIFNWLVINVIRTNIYAR